MKSFFYFLGALFFLASCVSVKVTDSGNTSNEEKKLSVIDDAESEEITFIL